MKERPIPFSAPMVRAVLSGTKTQTRRVIKAPGVFVSSGAIDGHGVVSMTDAGIREVRCPYGEPGDRLWVRETWRADSDHDDAPPRDIPEGSQVWFEADRGLSAIRGLSRMGKLRPSMFMPRWASRLTLEVTGVRVERLQDISQADAVAEGAPPSSPGIDRISREFGFADFSRSWYGQLWEQINGPGSWDLNPWVWVVEFRRADHTAQQPAARAA